MVHILHRVGIKAPTVSMHHCGMEWAMSLNWY